MAYVINGAKVNFTIKFTADSNITIYSSYRLTDILPTGVSFDSGNSKIEAAGVTGSVGSFDSWTSGNPVTATITNTAAIAGKEITVTIATTVDNADAVAASGYKNTATVTVNNTTLTTTSNEVTVPFVYTIIFTDEAPVPAVVDAINGQAVALKTLIPAKRATTDAAANNHLFTDYPTIVLKNVIGAGLAYDAATTSVKANSTDLTWTADATTTSGTVILTITNAATYDANDIEVVLGTKVTGIPELPNGTYPTGASITNKFVNIVNVDTEYGSSTDETIDFRRRVASVIKAIV